MEKCVSFVVVFHYMDGEEFEVSVHPDDMDKFMKSIGSSEVYFNASKGVGVWVPIDKVRYFHVERVDQNGKRVKEPESVTYVHQDTK